MSHPRYSRRSSAGALGGVLGSTVRPEPVTVLVTAIGGAEYGEQILKALRIAGRYRIVGASWWRSAHLKLSTSA
jgi:hypothetical protein